MADKPKIKMAQWGTKHGHARSVLNVMLDNEDVEFVGVYEEDSARVESIKDDPVWSQVHWFSSPSEMLDNPDIACIASEGLNAESLDQSEAIIDSGKHLWYDKPAGDDYPQWERVVAKARANSQLIQMGPGRFRVDMIRGQRRNAAPVVDASLDQLLQLPRIQVGRHLDAHGWTEQDTRDCDSPEQFIQVGRTDGIHLRVRFGHEVLHDDFLQLAVLIVLFLERVQTVEPLLAGLADADQ